MNRLHAWCVRLVSNQRPPPCQGGALPLSYGRDQAIITINPADMRQPIEISQEHIDPCAASRDAGLERILASGLPGRMEHVRGLGDRDHRGGADDCCHGGKGETNRVHDDPHNRGCDELSTRRYNPTDQFPKTHRRTSC